MPARHTDRLLQRGHTGLPRAWSWMGREVPGLDRYQLLVLQGYTLLRTDRNGWIELSTDGVEMWVEVEKMWEDLD